ncbi:GH25 family lysozyme [uncultured Lactobacillus sp.]|uniref:GH25 family lysozyme n=1 Tax=uncultured Lactobacillus sp. TaxID=153152 RepID=UPI002627E61A|nr:GH25 family lysozyme [uncultured Lactobacillus sp.]
MQKNTFGVDVASYQSKNLDSYAKAGAKFAIVKVSQSTTYTNPNGAGQIASAKANHMEVMGYFYATFSGNSSIARLEAQYAVATAKVMGLPAGSYLATDWETGSGNVTRGPAAYNTSAILTSMDVIKQAGYKPMLYSGASLLKNAVFTSQIIAKYSNSLWVAAYPAGNGTAVSSPNFNYFPSMDGVAIWQFTDNWRNLGVDGNIAIINTDKQAEKEGDEMSWHPLVNYNELGRFMVTRPSGAQLYEDATLTQPIKGSIKKPGETYKIFKAKDGAVNAGGSQWFAQSDGITKINPLAVNDKANGVVCQITADDAYTQAETKPSAGIEHLPKGNSYKVFGRVGKYLIVYGKNGGKYLSANKCKIILY